MPSLTQTRFLAARRVAHLATADREGRPHVVPVCFALSEDNLYITIDEKPKGRPQGLTRLKNISENPFAAVIVDRYEDDWSRLGWVMLRGRAEILEGGAEHERAQALLRERYPQLRPMRLEGLPVIALRIERATGWGNLTAD
jgi:PPOX class probable F420-dependent enzyme